MPRTATAKRSNSKPSHAASRRSPASRPASRRKASRLPGIRVHLLGIADRLTRVANNLEADEPGIAATLRRQAELTVGVVAEPGLLESQTNDELDYLLEKAAAFDPLSFGIVVPD